MKIVIDPGHGGKDPGAVSVGGRYKEKDNTLAIARHIHGKEINLPGVQFAYTRLEDKHLADTRQDDLRARVKFANDINANLFISIHQNADEQHKGHGAEAFYYGSSAEGKKLAEKIHESIIGNTNLYDRGIKTAGFYVIKYTDMAAVLVEAGFIGGTSEEAEYVSRKDTIGQIAEGIMFGIANYLGIEYGPKKPTWNPQAEINQLVSDGVINTPRTPEQQVTWGEFATILNRIKKG